MTELGTLLAPTVTRLFGDLVTKELIESAEKGAWPDKLWRALEEGGLTLPLVPEEAGGAGGNWADAHVVVRAAGKHAAPVPLAETIVACWLLAQARLEVPLGPLTVAPVREGEPLRLTQSGGVVAAERDGHAACRGARAAGHVVVVAEVDGAPMVALVRQGAAQVTRDRNLALEPRDTLAFNGAPVVAAAPGRSARRRRRGDRARRDGPRRPDGGRARVAARAVGALRDGAQAVRPAHRQLPGHPAQPRHPGRPRGRRRHRGRARVPAPPIAATPAFEVAVAKVRAGEAAGIGAGIAHQAHGAIGFTYEHSLHFSTRRLWSWRAEFGSESRWAQRAGPRGRRPRRRPSVE